ncbi:MAG: cyclic nucleotide-binding domain-containing protein [Rhodospirillaceae bacterium]|nr:cyclic nucleotide-binding domain-containing protein [Rhodospirillaceae bacterium]
MNTFGTGSPQQQTETSMRAKPGELLHREPFGKDKVIFQEGHDGTDAFILESGRVGVFKMTNGKPVRLGVLEKGAMFGEMAAITGARRSATTIALEPSVVVRISKTTIQQKLGSCDPFIKALVAILINNLSRVNERYATTNTVAEKLLSDLKAAQAIKDVPAAETETPPATPSEPGDKTGPRGKDGGAP